MKPSILNAAACCLAVLAAGPASALSCIAPSVADTYRNAAESSLNYVIVTGSIDVTGQSTPPEGAVALNGDINQMQGYTQPARVEGRIFTGAGFTQDWSADVTYQVDCTVAWCGAAGRIDDGLFFIRQTAAGSYVLDATPCPFAIFHNPTAAQRAAVLACHTLGC